MSDLFFCFPGPKVQTTQGKGDVLSQMHRTYYIWRLSSFRTFLPADSTAVPLNRYGHHKVLLNINSCSFRTSSL